MAAATIRCLKVALVPAEANQASGAQLARWKMPPQPIALPRFLHSMVWSTGCWLGQLDPRVGSKMPPRRPLAAPCDSQTLVCAASPWKSRRGTMMGTLIFGGPRPQSSTTPMVASPADRLVSGLSGSDPGGAGARFSSQTVRSGLLVPLQPVLARRQRSGSGPRAPALSRPCYPSAISDVWRPLGARTGAPAPTAVRFCSRPRRRRCPCT